MLGLVLGLGLCLGVVKGGFERVGLGVRLLILGV